MDTFYSFFKAGEESFYNKNNINLFEKHIYECLVDIYGAKNLKNALTASDSDLFRQLICMYNLPENLYNHFLFTINKYMIYNEKLSDKTSFLLEIEASIINMFLYKGLSVKLTLEEISHFENDLLNNFEIVKLHFKRSLNPNIIREIWNKKKKILLNTIELIEVKPILLDDYTYSLYGTSLDQVRDMDYRMVEKLNSFINSRTIEINDIKKPKEVSKFKKLNVILTSGSGFVDALMLLSIIVTELSIGAIYLFLHL